ncbi:hypothetical protein [Streptomyces sp. NBC_01264]|uniref:hypothetical protein n=1 Tax=Streptomyces sp. NBC_01264 TaxID=2903804 RepID=UPI002255C43D|nr:hypothetical protein [Streptomyces sp. NBC_01264]MCX4780417.1 hypothetical protein [Streptomyces sp. NBC_01264]
MNKSVRMRSGAALAGVALLVSGLAACGADGPATGKGGGSGTKTEAAGPPKPEEAVKAAYLKTVAAKSAKVELTTTDPAGKISGQSGAKGWYPYSHDMLLKRDGADKRSVMIGEVIWTKLDKPLKGKSWMKMDLAADGKKTARRGEDPAEYLAMLLGQDTVRYVGAEQADGIETQHYKAILTGPELLKADEATKVMEEKNRQYLHEAVKEIKELRVDVWIGKDGYPVRYESTETGPENGPLQTKATFSAFGTAPAVTEPPAGDTVDFDEVMGR